MEACYGGTDVMEMERSCAVARGIDTNTTVVVDLSSINSVAAGPLRARLLV
jgi:hypothetical protein